MMPDKIYRTELHRTFLLESLPEPLTRSSAHLQLFDNYIHETRLRLRSVRVPETKEWTLLLQKRESAGQERVQEIELSEGEYEHFKPFEGNEIRKNRYFHEFGGKLFEFDVYLGPLWGLNRARAHFTDRRSLESFVPPAFAVVEITGLPFFDDANLVNHKFEEVQAEVGKMIA